MEASGRVGLRIHPGVFIARETRRQHLLPKREGISQNSGCFAHGEHGGGGVVFFYSEDPYLASQHNDHRTTLRFGRHANTVTIDKRLVCDKFMT